MQQHELPFNRSGVDDPIAVLGWLKGIPKPLTVLFPLSLIWISAKTLLCVNQDFAWSMTVINKMDISCSGQRGLVTDINEYDGCGGIMIAGMPSNHLMTGYNLHKNPFYLRPRRIRHDLGHSPAIRHRYAIPGMALSLTALRKNL